MLAFFHDVALMRTNAETVAATNTFFRDERYLRALFPRFRIVAPDAVQGTPFQEHRRADSGSIMDGEFLNVEYDAA